MQLFEIIENNEASIRLSFFLGSFILIALWEWVAPKRRLVVSKLKRWANNISMVVLNTVLIRLIFPTATVGMAVFAESNGLGIFHYLAVPSVIEILASIIVLDLVIYFQHVVVHHVPVLWRIHRVHHADLDYDVTTGARFHPIEIMFSMLVKFVSILILGPSVVAVVVFEVILNTMSMFNHGNIGLPKGIETWLRWFIVTPDMHRVHHSQIKSETNSNFGFNLSCWDRLFGTYRAQPEKGHILMDIGLENFPNERITNRILGMLEIPFIEGETLPPSANQNRATK